jgi:hypothetical protein
VAAPFLFSLNFSVRGPEAFVGSAQTAQGGTVVRCGAETVSIREGIHLLLNDVLQASADGPPGGDS